jgi:predicted enzyme related to lactoylglutathione lyase
MNDRRTKSTPLRHAYAAAVLLGACMVAVSAAPLQPEKSATVTVGAQYDTTHVYVASGDLDALVNSFVATFGGKPSARMVTSVLPVPSRTQFQAVATPVGSLSAFAYETPIPYPFGQERTGYLVTDMDLALKEARAAGAEVIVDQFKDPIGRDAIIQWPGGIKMQLYWHFTAPAYPPLATIPDNRVYISPDTAEDFVRGFVRFSGGRVVADDKRADAGEIGHRGATYRRIDIESGFGRMRVLITDGHLPYPFGHELTGYEVKDIGAILAKAVAAGGKVLSPPYVAGGRSSAIVTFPGGYIAEIHAAAMH